MYPFSNVNNQLVCVCGKTVNAAQLIHCVHSLSNNDNVWKTIISFICYLDFVGLLMALITSEPSALRTKSASFCWWE